VGQSIASKLFSSLKRNETIEEEVLDYKLRWEDLTFADKAKFFKWWSLVTLVDNVIQMFGSLFFIFKSDTGLLFSEVLCGLGCMLCWISLV
jgi:hypothetical protein